MYALSRMDCPVVTSQRKSGAISWNEAGITVTLHQLHTTVIASYNVFVFSYGYDWYRARRDASPILRYISLWVSLILQGIQKQVTVFLSYSVST